MKLFRNLFVGVLALLSFSIVADAQSRGRAVADDDSGYTAIRLRCALWQPVEKLPALYFKEGREFKIFPLFVMAFQREYIYKGPTPIPVYRKATAEEVEQRKAAGVKKSELDYIPVFTIDPKGMRDIGVVLLPGKFEKKPAKEILVFDWSDRQFPYGTTRIANFSRRGLIGQLVPRGEKSGENFKLKHGAIFTSKPLTEKRKIYELQIAALVNKQPQVIYSSAAAFTADTRTMVFIIPAAGIKTTDDEAPKLDFRTIRDRKRPEPKPTSKRSGNKDKPDAEKSAEK